MAEAIDMRCLRAALGWTQDQMAEYLGVDRSSVSRMEGGQQPVSGPVDRLLRVLASTPIPQVATQEAT